MIAFGRFALAILYVTVATALLRTGDFRPTAALYIPVVALAAAQGTRQAIIVGAAAISLYLVPVLSAAPGDLVIDAQRAVALSGTAILLSIGTRRSISALTLTVRRLGASLARDRRRSRQVAAVESVGRLLAATGPAAETLERIVELLARRPRLRLRVGLPRHRRADPDRRPGRLRLGHRRVRRVERG